MSITHALCPFRVCVAGSEADARGSSRCATCGARVCARWSGLWALEWREGRSGCEGWCAVVGWDGAEEREGMREEGRGAGGKGRWRRESAVVERHGVERHGVEG